MMKAFPLAIALLAAGAAQAQTSVGISVGINQPGVYGRIDIGNFPQPAVVYPQPVVIAPSPVAVYQRPIYLYVPPGQYRDWSHYCHEYHACNQPVYFAREDWVREHYGEEARRGHGYGRESHEGRGDHGRHGDRRHD